MNKVYKLSYDHSLTLGTIDTVLPIHRFVVSRVYHEITTKMVGTGLFGFRSHDLTRSTSQFIKQSIRDCLSLHDLEQQVNELER